MSTIEVRDMQPDDEYFVSTCSHVNESDETDACGRRRLAWLQQIRDRGGAAQVALLDGQHVGFLYCVPIEVAPQGPIGEDLMVIPCLWVLPPAKSKGVGGALVRAAEEQARRQGAKGIVTVAHYSDFWFMPAAFFEKQGYAAAQRRGQAAVMWKVWDDSAVAPRLLEPKYEFAPAPGKVVVDLFYGTFCQTVDIEAQRVREVAAEFGDAVVLNQYCTDQRDVLLRYERPRGIFVDGQEIGWGYEAPRDGIRDAIQEALAQN